MKAQIKILILCFSILFLYGCENKVKAPVNSKLVAKYITFEDSISSKLIQNLKDVKEFDNNGQDYKPSFKLDGKYYKFEREYRVDSKGFLKVLHEHLYYTFNYADYGIKKDSIKDRETLGQRFFLKFSKSYDKIIDCGDTLDIKKINPEKKLIFVKQHRNDGRVWFYEYK